MPKTAFRVLLVCLVLALGSACTDPTVPGERELTVEVASTRAPCVGVVPMECLQVRWNANGSWELFYDSIEGFTWEPGNRYLLRVARREILDPPADGPSAAFRLLEVLSKVAE